MREIMCDPRVKVWNKLVRDRMTEVIRGDGFVPVTVKLSGQDKIGALIAKIEEESSEIAKAYKLGDSTDELIEEVADLSEVLDELKCIVGKSRVEECQVAKRESRGGFTEGVFLIEVTIAQ